MVLWAHLKFLNPNGISIGSAVFAGLSAVTDRPTDHATYVVLRRGLKTLRIGKGWTVHRMIAGGLGALRGR